MYKEVTNESAMGFLATKPTMIITTLHESGIVNGGAFGAYTGLSGSQIGVAVGRSSDTYANTLARGEFVICVPGADLVKTIRIFGTGYPPEVSEVAEAGLTLKDGITVDTPSIAECVAAVEFKFEKEVPIGAHSFLIGKATGGWIKEEFLDSDGEIDIFKARIIKDFKYPKPLYVLPGEVIEG